MSGSIDYFSGDGRLKHIGLPGPEFYNLNRELRAWNSTSGCVVYGYEALTHEPNNVAIKFWTSILGFQKNVYTGYYPDKIQTDSIIASKGKTTPFTKNELKLSFELNNDKHCIFESAHRDMQSLDSCNLASVAAVNGELIIFKPQTSGDEKVTYLADFTTGKVFARYYEYEKENTSAGNN